MNMWHLSLGMVPTPPVPILPAPPEKKRSSGNTTKRTDAQRALSQQNLARANAKRMEQREADLVDIIHYLGRSRAVTSRAVALRFSWSGTKAIQMLGILLKRGKAEKFWAGRECLWRVKRDTKN